MYRTHGKRPTGRRVVKKCSSFKMGIFYGAQDKGTYMRRYRMVGTIALILVLSLEHRVYIHNATQTAYTHSP